MAVEAFNQVVAATSQAQTPETPEQSQQQSTVEARTEVTYGNAGQEPPTPQTAQGILPHIKGGLRVWIVIVLLLLLAHMLWRHSGGVSVSASASVGEGE